MSTVSLWRDYDYYMLKEHTQSFEVMYCIRFAVLARRGLSWQVELTVSVRRDAIALVWM